MIKKILSGFLILFLSSILYISFFGISTDKFNQRIEKKFGSLKNTVDIFLSDKNYEIINHKQVSRLIIKKLD